MDLRDFERGGDVLQLLALFAGDAVVRQQHEIGRPDDLLLGRLIEVAGGCREPGDDPAVPRIGLRFRLDLLRRERPSRLVLDRFAG